MQQVNITKLGIFKKSIEIFNLSRRIVSYITYDTDVISLHRSKKPINIYADRLVMNALSLVPKVTEIETESDLNLKLKRAKLLRLHIDKLNSDCFNLENTKLPGKEFLRVFRKELKNLQDIHSSYVNSIAKV